MSRQLALDTVNLKPVDHLAHTEYSLNYHKDYIRKLTGVDGDAPGALRAIYDAWDIDFDWFVSDGLHGNWDAYGRSTDMGHADYAADAGDHREAAACPFTEPEEVWAFDAVKEYGLPDRDEQIRAYEELLNARRAELPNQLITGGYYKTLVSGAIQAFGWDMFLLSLAEPDRMEPVLDSFFRRTLFHMECWARTSVEVCIQHDDFVWSEGAFMNPEIYRKVLIPRYAELWKPLHAAGKKVLFCSDANFMEFTADLAEAGADGFIFEPMNDFDWMVERFGQSHCLVGSAVDCRDMTFGKWDKVKADMDRTFALAERCKGVIFATGNHLPANIPEAMMERYIRHFQANR
ncbi:MAG: hypothetical protein JW951_05705 [Lentisphaerae bacterium]|nr:hypothetical protein [Lentisphaerota bacterium]